MTKSKNVYFAINYNGIILVEVPRRLGISPNADNRTIQTVLDAQDFFDSRGCEGNIVVYALGQHPDLEYKLAVAVTSEGYAHYIPNVYTSDDLRSMGGEDVYLQQGNPTRMPEATLQTSLKKILEWAKPLIKKGGGEALGDTARENLDDEVRIPFLGRFVRSSR